MTAGTTTAASDVGTGNTQLSDGNYDDKYDLDGNVILRWQASGSGETQPGTGDTDISVYAWDNRNRLTSVTHYATYADY